MINTVIIHIELMIYWEYNILLNNYNHEKAPCILLYNNYYFLFVSIIEICIYEYIQINFVL